MSEERKPAITLGVDAGGKDANDATRVHYMELRALLASECIGPYGAIYKEFALVLRVDGSVQSWSKSGVDNVRLQRKSGYATADIFVPMSIWKAQPVEVLREFLAAEIQSAVYAITERMCAANESIGIDRLRQDAERAARTFLSGWKKGDTMKYPSFDGHLITGTMPQEVLREQASKVLQGIQDRGRAAVGAIRQTCC